MVAAISTLDDLLGATDALLLAPDRGALIEAFEATLATFDMTSFVISGFPHPTSGHRAFHYHTGLRDWVALYDQLGLQRECPLTAHIVSQAGPIMVETIRARLDAGSRAAEICDMGREMGLAHGLMVPVHLRNGDPGGVSVLTASEIELPRDRSALHMLALAFHAQFEAMGGTAKAEGGGPLSMREADVLRWFAEGKSTEDVSALMRISTSTVMFHYRNVATRLGTINRTQTVVEAMRRGLMGR